jgi:D-amino-acid dehydrogenase
VKSQILKDHGCDIRTLDREETVKLDPALENVKHEIAGSLYAANDESGDCRLFARNLGKWLAERGVTFRFGTAVTGFEMEGDGVKAVVTDKGRYSGDVYVLCLGVYSRASGASSASTCRSTGQGLLDHGAVAGRNNPPRIGGVDEENLTAYCPLGDRLRVTARRSSRATTRATGRTISGTC